MKHCKNNMDYLFQNKTISFQSRPLKVSDKFRMTKDEKMTTEMKTAVIRLHSERSKSIRESLRVMSVASLPTTDSKENSSCTNQVCFLISAGTLIETALQNYITYMNRMHDVVDSVTNCFSIESSST